MEFFFGTMAAVSPTPPAVPTAAHQSRSEREQQDFEDTSDFANYFCTYEYLYHQQQMLEDQRRMNAYHDAIMQNKPHFAGKVVLDVGAGSGILSIWAAKAGAAKVYGIEATKVAHHARLLVKCNGVQDVVEIIQSEVEKVELPVQVDVIISEWMGYFLLRESMLDSVIYARDKFLKPGGLLYPNRARMYIAPVFNDDGERKNTQCQSLHAEWVQFVRETRRKYGVDMNCLTPAYQREQSQFYLGSAQWADLPGSDLVGRASCVSEIDLYTTTVDGYRTIIAPFSCPILGECLISGFAGWFSALFEGAPGNPTQRPVTLDTAPGTGYTHWGQQMFSFLPCMEARQGETFCGTIEITRRAENQRLLNVKLTYAVKQTHGDAVTAGPVTNSWQIQ